MCELTVIYWRDIPAQVKATAGAASARTQLDDRFQLAIDAAAMRAGLSDSDAYLDEWRRVIRPCGEALDDEVATEVARLDALYDTATVRRLVRAGGLADGAEPG